MLGAAVRAAGPLPPPQAAPRHAAPHLLQPGDDGAHLKVSGTLIPNVQLSLSDRNLNLKMFFDSFVESSRVATKYLEKLRLEFILEEEYLNSFRRVHLQHQEHSPIFDIARIFNACDNLKVSGATPVSLLVAVGFAI